MIPPNTINELMGRMGRSIIGQSHVVERLPIGLLANGSPLLAGLPGLAKTRAVKSLASNKDRKSVKCIADKRRGSMKKVLVRTIGIYFALVSLGLAAAGAPDPLPSWNDGSAKRAITRFVEAVSTPGGPEFVPPAELIAVFDNDETLWSEQPMYFQLAFAVDRVNAWRRIPCLRILG